MVKPLILLELNEINFDYVGRYIARGELPNLGSLIQQHGIAETTSESKYEDLEPWIQWVSAHTGLPLRDHKIFRLGDVVHTNIDQIWELLERQGLRVGAMSPMNAKYRLNDPAFFVPDPWTNTDVKARPVLANLYKALAQAVNDNAAARLTASSLKSLLVGLIAYARPVNYAAYAGLALRSRSRPWRKAMFLDLLLADVFMSETRRTQPHFASLFLNAAAHVQHHYMFSSAAYDGEQRNPAWYAPPNIDPVLEVYALYDRIIGQMRSVFRQSRIMLATGLRQVPYLEQKYYWRLRNHQEFLRSIRVPFATVLPRMSRDFLVTCHDENEAKLAEHMLTQAVADGVPLFTVDNRGTDLFVMLSYPYEIKPGLGFTVGGQRYNDLHPHVAFVAIKNGEHHGTGYFLDTGSPKGSLPAEFALTELPGLIANALGISLPQTTA